MGEAAVDLGELVTQKRKAKPYAPYTIVTTDGRRFPVVRPTQAAYNGLFVLVVPPNGDTSTIIPSAQLAAIED